MYLHIGNKKSVKKKDIIGIFDLDTATVSGITKRFINKNQKEGKVEYTDTDLPRSFILLDEGGECCVKLSRISTGGLRLRAEGAVIDSE
nr:DUF370 domain-containing protein [Clostridia bacterium]